MVSRVEVAAAIVGNEGAERKAAEAAVAQSLAQARVKAVAAASTSRPLALSLATAASVQFMQARRHSVDAVAVIPSVANRLLRQWHPATIRADAAAAAGEEAGTDHLEATAVHLHMLAGAVVAVRAAASAVDEADQLRGHTPKMVVPRRASPLKSRTAWSRFCRA